MNISEKNRNDAYFAKNNKETQAESVFSLLSKSENGHTIGELSYLLKLPKSTISARVNELKPNVIAVGTRYDAVTKCSVTIWKCNINKIVIIKEKKQTDSKKIKLIKAICLKNSSELSFEILEAINK